MDAQFCCFLDAIFFCVAADIRTWRNACASAHHCVHWQCTPFAGAAMHQDDHWLRLLRLPTTTTTAHYYYSSYYSIILLSIGVCSGYGLVGCCVDVSPVSFKHWTGWRDLPTSSAPTPWPFCVRHERMVAAWRPFLAQNRRQLGVSKPKPKSPRHRRIREALQ